MRAGEQVLQPLVNGQAVAAPQQLAAQQHLEPAAGPAQLLLEVRPDLVRCESPGQYGWYVDGSPTSLVDFQRRPDVLGVAAGGDAADVIECLTPEHHDG